MSDFKLMRERFVFMGLLLPNAVGVGCSPSSAPGSVVRHDSAGIEIVENFEPSWRNRDVWMVEDEPIVDIGGLGSGVDYELYQVMGAVRMSDGRIVIVNYGSHELLFYDPRGVFLSRVGREGGGPGEFIGMGRVRRMRDDSLAVGDFRIGRVSIFDAHGRFGRSIPTEEPVRRYSVTGVFEDGELLLAGGFGLGGWTTGARGVGVALDSLLYVTARGSVVAADTIGNFPSAAKYVTNTGARWSVTEVPFGQTSVAAPGRSSFYIGFGTDFSYRRYTRSGQLTRIVRFAKPNRSVNQSDIDRYIENRITGAPPNLRRFWQNRMRTTPFPNTMTAFASFEVDVLENLWVEEYRPAWDTIPHHWVFDSTGVLLGSVTLPHGLEVFDIGSDFVLGRWTDTLDVEHVRMHRLRKP